MPLPEKNKNKNNNAVLSVLINLHYEYNRITTQTIQPSQNLHINVRTNTCSLLRFKN